MGGYGWIPCEYLELLKLRDRLYVRWKKVPNRQTEMDFKNIKNQANNLRNKLKVQYAEKRFHGAKGNHKKIWEVLNDICNRQKRSTQKITTIKGIDGQMVNSENQIAVEFNQHFSTIGDPG